MESNIELGLESKKVPKEERPAIIDKYVKMVGLDHARNRYPAELSGGMQQRVFYCPCTSGGSRYHFHGLNH